MTAHLTRVKSRLAIHAHRKVRGLLEGEYAAVQTGRSMDFNDLREYVRGDDVKDIDWKASARSRALLVKRFVAIRKHTVLLVVSTGRSMAATNAVSDGAVVAKRDLAATVAGLVGFLAVRHGDLVAMAYGDAGGCTSLPAAAGEVRLERALSAAYDATRTDGPAADLTGLLRHVARTVRRRTILLVVADEYQVDDALSAALRRLVVQHEVLFCGVGDLDPTGVGDAASIGGLVDVDTGQGLPDWLAGDAELAGQYAATVTGDADQMRRALDRIGVVHERVRDEPSAISAVFRLLERHRHARR